MLTFRTISKVLKFSILLILLVKLSSAAVIEGKVYSWENFEPLSNVVVEINTTPEQKILSKDGSYSFNVSPGSYKIVAKYYKNGELVMIAEENVTVVREGTYRIDLLLVPVIEIEEPKLGNITFEEIDVKGGENSYSIYYPLLILFAAPVFYLALRAKRVKEGEKELPEDLKRVVEEIKAAGGRITQKELRERLGVSEAKLSLMLADLERRGIIEKYKKGRGNVIFLK